MSHRKWALILPRRRRKKKFPLVNTITSIFYRQKTKANMRVPYILWWWWWWWWWWLLLLLLLLLLTPFLHVRKWQDGDYHKVLTAPVCLNPESLIVAGCQQYLDRFTWRHDSNLNFIAKSLQTVINVHSSLYADVNGFLNPSITQLVKIIVQIFFSLFSPSIYVF